MKFLNFLTNLLFTFCILFPFKVNSQTLLISPAKIDEPGFGFTKVIGQDSAGYYLLMSNLSLNSESDRIGFKNRKYKIAYYNHSLTKKWSKALDAPSDDSYVDIVSFFNGRALIVTSVYRKQDQKLECSVNAIDNNGTVINNSGPVVVFSNIGNDYEKCKIVFSITRRQFGLLVREFTNDTSQTLSAAILDTTFNIISQKSVTVPFSEKKFDFGNFALSVNGDLAMLGYHSEKIKALSSKRKIDYYIYVSNKNDTKFKEYLVPSQKSISSLGIAFDNFNNQVVLSGFYFERESNTGTGIFYATIDVAKNDELKFTTKVIEGPNSSNLKRERSLSSGTGIMDYPVERLVVRNDGGAIIVAEAAYTTEFSYYDSFSQSFTQQLEYHFENVIVISVNPDASVDWSAVVEKNQVSLDDEGVFSSFCALVNSEQFLILYNDDISKRNKIMPAVISNKGVLTKGKTVYTSEGFILLPRSGKQVSESELLVPAYKKRDLHLIRFTFE